MQKRIVTAFLALAVFLSLLTSCGKAGATGTENVPDTVGTTISADNTAAVNAEGIANQYSAKDTETSYDQSSATKITLNGSSMAVEGAGATAEGSVLTISAGGVYVLSGALSDGQILVRAAESDDVRLVLNGVNITCSTGAPIYAASADTLIITLADGTKNILTDGGSGFKYADATAEEPDAALFAKCDLTINGSGALTVNADFNNGIGTKDDLVIVNGSYTVNAKNDGLRGRDSVTILDGRLTITAGGDGIQSNNDEDAAKGWISIENGTYTVTAANDGIQAQTVLSVAGGTFTVKTGSGTSDVNSTDSYKGLKAGTDMAISGGTFTIESADDSVHANGNIAISGGDFTLASGDDGIHADIDLSVTGGKINITKSYEGMEGATITIANGTIDIVASDDAINAAGGDDGGVGGGFGQDKFSSSGNNYVDISGGTISFTAGGDGIDSNREIHISGGTVTALIQSSPDNGAIDCDGTFTATGGTIIYGGTGMGSAPAGSSTQSYVFVSGSFSQGTVITVKKDGKTLATATLGIDCQTLALSTPDIISGQSYEVYNGNTLASTVTAGTGGASGGMGGGPGGGMGGGPRGGGGQRP